MCAIGNIVADAVFWFSRGGDTAFGDDFHFLAQLRSQFKRFAKRGFALVSPVNIGVIDRGNAQIEMRFDKADPFTGRHVPVHQAPVTHHQTGEFRALGRESNTLNHLDFLSKK